MDSIDIKALYRTCYPQVARYILQRGGSKTEAEDAFHSALAAMLNPNRAGEAIENPGAFLFRSAWNAFLREQRYRRRNDSGDTEFTETDPEDDPDNAGGGPATLHAVPVEPGPAPDRLADQSLLSAVVWEEIRKLPAGAREVLELTFDPELDLDEAEIGGILEISREAVKVKRARAVAELRKRLRRRGLGFLIPTGKKPNQDE